MKQTKKQKLEKIQESNKKRQLAVKMMLDARFNNKPLDYSVLKALYKEIEGGCYVANLKAINFGSKYR